MRYYSFFYKVKVLKIIVLTITILGVTLLMKTMSEQTCYEYVGDLCYECDGIGQLNEYISYNMLSSKLKKYIKKEDLKFSSDKEIWEFSQKIQQIDYEYNSDRKGVYSTNSLKYNPFWKQIEIDNKYYNITFVIVFAPRIFPLNPKIADWNVSIWEIPDVQK